MLRRNWPPFGPPFSMNFQRPTSKPCSRKSNKDTDRTQVLILIDSNIPMYLIGEASSFKVDSQLAVQRLLSQHERLVTDAEVFQEILHRYSAIKRLDAIQPAFDAILKIVDDVLAVDLATVERAKQIVFAYRRLSARDAVHLAVMEQHGVDRVLSFDKGFDGFPGVTRLSS